METKTLQSLAIEVVEAGKHLISVIREFEDLAESIQSFDACGANTQAVWIDKDHRDAEESLMLAIGAFEEEYERMEEFTNGNQTAN